MFTLCKWDFPAMLSLMVVRLPTPLLEYGEGVDTHTVVRLATTHKLWIMGLGFAVRLASCAA